MLPLINSAIGPAERSAAIRRWNAYVPPPVEDWRPAGEVTSDVAEPDLAIEDYDMAAEHLIALLHNKIDGIGRFSPDTLPMIDAYFYRANYPARFDRADIDADLVPALGGYVGEVLRRRLGGRWCRARTRTKPLSSSATARGCRSRGRGRSSSRATVRSTRR